MVAKGQWTGRRAWRVACWHGERRWVGPAGTPAHRARGRDTGRGMREEGRDGVDRQRTETVTKVGGDGMRRDEMK